MSKALFLENVSGVAGDMFAASFADEESPRWMR